MNSKGAGDENFPVASWLLPAHARPHIMAFYGFARAADDVADSLNLGTPEKIASLTAMVEQLKRGSIDPYSQVFALHQSLVQTGVSSIHGQDLLKAFLHDAQHPRTLSWDDLIAYCALSAAPVGRYLIDLLGGLRRGHDFGANDSLCAALQILNHIQDVKGDFIDLGRVYVPTDWLKAANVSDDDLKADHSSPQLREVLNRMLDRVDGLLRHAEELPKSIGSKSLAREAAGIVAIAKVLSKKLRHEDPIAGRVELSKPHAAAVFLWGALNP